MEADCVKRSIDINCDLGESFGIYTFGQDEPLFDLITSCNIACGFHAGDPATMAKTVQIALQKQVAIGAHPGFPDLQGFGRRNVSLSPREVYEIVLYQIGALDSFVQAARGTLHHVKPHGALYHQAASDPIIAEAIATAVFDFRPQLILYGLAHSKLVEAGKNKGLKVASEAFIDRRYRSDGTLCPRSQADACIDDPITAAEQALHIAMNRQVLPYDTPAPIPIQADTLCLHGDHASALEIIQQVRQELKDQKIHVQPAIQFL
ncbi:LamB/YcsF family protein [Hazenella sp. IB182357]|uniref:5-oxoprolinase subunit A n=1 Tax=Polycladospora coralii TaxID=2771432 RepID=A0A926N9G8_9BACL|nr:LamB/YcsF family protein [Polycladospora coralii]